MNAKNLDELERDLTQMKLDFKSKVSWKQLGGTAVVIIALLGFIWGGLDLTRSGEIKNVKTACETNSKQVQTFSINQAVIADKLGEVSKRLEKMEEKRESDIRIIHQRITDTKDTIIQEIRKLDK